MKIDGLVSGLKTAEVIDALMKVHAIPQSLLSAKITDRTSVVGNLQSLNTGLQQLFDKAKNAGSPTSLAAFTATSSHESVTVSAGAKANPLTTPVVVDAVASTHSVVTAAGAGGTWGGAYTVVAADGTMTEISVAGTGAQDLARAIGASATGIVATVVAAGTDAGGAPLSRLQLSAGEPGAEATFTVFRGTAAEVAGGTATDVATEAGGAVIAQGADARIRLFAGTAAEQVLTSGSNSFALADDITVTVSRVSADPVTVTVAKDPKAQTAAAEAFVKEIAALLTRIDNGSKATVADPGGKTTLGVFTGDSTVRLLRTALTSSVQSPVDGTTPSSIGIVFDKKGMLTFDAATFARAVAEDPAATQAVFSQIAGRVQETTALYSDKYDGLLTQRITGQESEVKSLRAQVERWDLRLDVRRSALERTYAQLEVQLSTLQTQSSWLSSQLAGLSSTSSS